MRRSHTPAPVLGLMLAIGILFLIGILMLYGGQQRIAEELALIAGAQGLSAEKAAVPCLAPQPLPSTQNKRGSYFGKIRTPQPSVRGSTIQFDREPTQK